MKKEADQAGFKGTRTGPAWVGWRLMAAFARAAPPQWIVRDVEQLRVVWVSRRWGWCNPLRHWVQLILCHKFIFVLRQADLVKDILSAMQNILGDYSCSHAHFPGVNAWLATSFIYLLSIGCCCFSDRDSHRHHRNTWTMAVMVHFQFST